MTEALAVQAGAPDEMRSLLKSVRRILRANDLQSRALARSIGLTAPQLVIMMAVAELGEVTTKAVAEHADLSPATVVIVLDNLEQRGIVQRYRSTNDRRIVYNRLTPKGQQLISHAPGLFGPEFARRFAALPPQRRQDMLASLSELADLMSSLGTGPAPASSSAAPIQGSA